MNTWIKQKGYPLVTVIRDQHTGKIKITQEYFQLYKKMSIRKNTNSANIANRWWVPINFATYTNPDFSSTLVTHWLSPETEELVIDGINPQDWIIVNIQQTGKICVCVFFYKSVHSFLYIYQLSLQKQLNALDINLNIQHLI